MMNQEQAENFVTVWQTSASQAEVMERLGLARRQVTGRAYRLRKLGVRLKSLNRGDSSRPDDIDALNRLADSLNQD